MSTTAHVMAQMQDEQTLNLFSEIFLGRGSIPVLDPEERALQERMAVLLEADQNIPDDHVNFYPASVVNNIKTLKAIQKKAIKSICASLSKDKGGNSVDLSACGKVKVCVPPAPYPVLVLDQETAATLRLPVLLSNSQGWSDEEKLMKALPKKIRKAYLGGKWGDAFRNYQGTLLLATPSSKTGFQGAAALRVAGQDALYVGKNMNVYLNALQDFDSGDQAAMKEIIANLKDKINEYITSHNHFATDEEIADLAVDFRGSIDDVRIEVFLNEENASLPADQQRSMEDITDQEMRSIIPEIGFIAFTRKHPARLNLFIDHLKETESLENLAFMVAVSPHLKRLGPMCKDYLKDTNVNTSTTARLKAIYDEFVSRNSTYQININGTTRSYYQTIFNGSEEEVLQACSGATASVFYARAFEGAQSFCNSKLSEFLAVQHTNAGKIDGV